MRHKWTYEEVKSRFESEGYTLITSSYENSFQELEYRCPSGHEKTTTLSRFNQGSRCPDCYRQKRGATYEQVREKFESDGYKLLTEEYKHSYQSLYYECPNGHRNFTTIGAFRQGSRCPDCHRERIKAWSNERSRQKKEIKSSWIEEHTFSDSVARFLSLFEWNVFREYRCGDYGIADVFAERDKTRLIIECKLIRNDQNEAVRQLKGYGKFDPKALLFFACPELILEQKTIELIKAGIFPFPHPHEYSVKLPQGQSRLFISDTKGRVRVEDALFTDDWSILDIIRYR